MKKGVWWVQSHRRNMGCKAQKWHTCTPEATI